MSDEIENEFMKRGFLLPKGCKDLSDVWRARVEPASLPLQLPRQPEAPVLLPPITGEITVPSGMTVRDLAAALRQNPFRIVADLMKMGVFATLPQVVGFDAISKVMRKYGFAAKRAV